MLVRLYQLRADLERQRKLHALKGAKAKLERKVHEDQEALNQEIIWLRDELSNAFVYDEDASWNATAAGWKPRQKILMLEQLTLTLTIPDLLAKMENNQSLFAPPGWRLAKEMLVIVRDRPFGKGNFRRAHRMLSLGVTQERWVLKRRPFRAERSDEEGRMEMEMMVVCNVFATEFNKQVAVKKKVSFVAALPVKMSEEGLDKVVREVFATAEPMLEGEWIKFNNNSGFYNDMSRTAQAFSHYTYEKSDKKLMIVDLQGVKTATNYQFSDPAILWPHDQTKFGGTNRGAEGIQDFFETHSCNHICTALGLPRNPAAPSFLVDNSDTM